MFHVMLVLPVMILLAIVISALLFGLLAIIASLVGGASAALLVKNKLTRRLLLVGFGIVSFIGLLPVLPFVMAYISVPASYITAAVILMLVCVAALSIAGIRFSMAVNNKVGKVALTVVFCVVLTADLFLCVLAPIVSGLLMS